MRANVYVNILLNWWMRWWWFCFFFWVGLNAAPFQTHRTRSGSSAALLNVDKLRFGGIGGAELHRRWQIVGGRLFVVRIDGVGDECLIFTVVLLLLLPLTPPSPLQFVSSNVDDSEELRADIIDAVERRVRGIGITPPPLDIGSPISWNEFIELKPLSSSAAEFAIIDFRHRLMMAADDDTVDEDDDEEDDGILQNVWGTVVGGGVGDAEPAGTNSSSVSWRDDEEVECTESSVLLCIDNRLSRVFNLRCMVAADENDDSVGVLQRIDVADGGGPSFGWWSESFKNNDDVWERWAPDSLRMGSLRLSKFWAVRRRRKDSWDNLTGSGLRWSLHSSAARLGERRLLKNNNELLSVFICHKIILVYFCF